MKDNYTQTTKNLPSAHNSYLRHRLEYRVYKQVQAAKCMAREFVSNSIINIVTFWFLSLHNLLQFISLSVR